MKKYLYFGLVALYAIMLSVLTSCNGKTVEADKEWHELCQQWHKESDNLLVNTSTNYHIIDNRAIALNFMCSYSSELNMTILACTFSDITVGRGKDGLKEPSFSKEMTKIKCLGDSEDYFNLPIFDNNGDVLTISPYQTEEILKLFMDYDKITVWVTLSDGTNLTYTFNSSKGLQYNPK